MLATTQANASPLSSSVFTGSVFPLQLNDLQAWQQKTKGVTINRLIAADSDI